MPKSIDSRRSISYPDIGAEFNIPEEIWNLTVENLRSFGDQNSEGLVFWGGIVSGDSIQVSGLYILNHKPQGRSVVVTPEESRWLLKTLRHRDEKLVAQVHSHPGEAFHSKGDNERAASFHLGFLSIVLPNYAVNVHTISECFAVEYDGHQFVELNKQDMRNRIKILPLIENYYSADNQLEPPKGSSWNHLKLLSLKQKLAGPKKQ